MERVETRRKNKGRVTRSRKVKLPESSEEEEEEDDSSTEEC